MIIGNSGVDTPTIPIVSPSKIFTAYLTNFAPKSSTIVPSLPRSRSVRSKLLTFVVTNGKPAMKSSLLIASARLPVPWSNSWLPSALACKPSSFSIANSAWPGSSLPVMLSISSLSEAKYRGPGIILSPELTNRVFGPSLGSFLNAFTSAPKYSMDSNTSYTDPSTSEKCNSWRVKSTSLLSSVA